MLPFVTTAPANAADSGLRSAPQADHSAKKLDNRPSPLASQRSSARQQAVQELASGDATLKGRGKSRTIQRADGSEVDYPVSQSAKLLTFLVDFGDGAGNPAFPTQTAGPVNNEIPEPAASDNTTYWKADFNREHYLDMFFNGMPEQDGESFKDLYDEMSSGRFDLEGDVSDWVTVDHPESYYSDAAGAENQPEMTNFIGDSANAWYAAATAGKTPQQVKDYLAQYDVWDRYDMDGDGNYNEPDGYIDHFQAVHAGEGEEAGAAPWTIWSHRWSANIAGYGTDGPAEGSCDACFPVGGVEIGDSGYYIYDYTTEPENGGLGVFSHEFGHDLGLPDYYDTGDGDNSNGYWTLMDSGSWLGHGQDSIGSGAGHMGPTEKLFLGWYGTETDDGFDDLAVVDGLGDPQEVTLGPSYHATSAGKQAVMVTLPDGHDTANGPASGDYLYSGTRDGTTVTATSPTITLPSGSPQLTASVAYSIENGYDFAYLQVSDDGGGTWTSVPTSKSAAGTTGITGSQTTFSDLTADLSAYAGDAVKLRWSYVTDGNTHGAGLLVKNLSVGSYTTSFGASNDWTLDGFFSVVGGTYTYDFSQSYMAENRTFDGYDKTLTQGPYSFDYASSAPNKVDHYSYEDGLLLYYTNGAYGDNNTSEHPGHGANLPVDAQPDILTWSGTGASSAGNGRLQSFDATFDVDQNSALNLTKEVSGGTQSVSAPARAAVPVFEDSNPDAYYRADAGHGWFSTKVAGVGTEIQVVSSNETTDTKVLKIGAKFVAATSAATISGSPKVGSVLTSQAPKWFQSGVTSSVKWLRDGKAIKGATGAKYRVQPADAGHRISVSVTGAKSGYTSTTATSASTAKVAKGKVTLSVKPGKAKPGKKVAVTIKATSGSEKATGKVKVTYAGKSLGKVTLKNGKATVKLPGKKKGSYKLKVSYPGATGFGSASKTITVKVK
ncbi:immune inhibitor A [Nocardioides conyzicola]|uniref:Immune inhibitor A n=1 Tax=Nocardioides conyzicola TaxID=1651781 RepID=A0ABP8X5P7_9ACTN